MLQLRGGAALSRFRLHNLLADLRLRTPEIEGLHAEFWHFVELSADLDRAQESILTRLLEYGSPEPGLEGEQLIVVPRIGTVSPWSTKATDIARHCGLDRVRRLERGVVWTLATRRRTPLTDDARRQVMRSIHDPMTETVVTAFCDVQQLFHHAAPGPLRTVDVRAGGRDALARANRDWGLALSDDELDYLEDQFSRLRRNPTDVELMMFAQVNSEHCRHKIFNARWIIDGQPRRSTLFEMIRETDRHNRHGTISAYEDNAAVIEGSPGNRFFPTTDGEYAYHEEPIHIVCKVETHNHPTAISPFPGAATGSGGEIRDEGATGIGAKPKAGLTGFSVSNLRIPGAIQPWETPAALPARIATPLEIMLEGPVGGAAFNNEFGRPNIAGYFRTYEQTVPLARGSEVRGYHKPIMLAGGIGNVRAMHAHKRPIPAGARIVVLGGPAMLIGLGGGAASSLSTGASEEELDFASVQRGNPEMQRRCQEVIDRCWSMGPDNPILSIHDVGAGGLCNALPELVHGAGRGGDFELRRILSDDPGMTPMQIWCNESQERYVLAIPEHRLQGFIELCERERCLYCVVGRATGKQSLRLSDADFADDHERGTPIDMSMDVLFGKPPQMIRDVTHRESPHAPLDLDGMLLAEALHRVLRLPGVADKTFLITIGDRSVTGLVSRDQMVGPWQVPVADVAVTCADYSGYCGEAMAVGERAPLAVIDPAASGRMAVAEALTNIMAADVRAWREIKLSANWMAAADHPGEDAALFDTVEAVALDLCRSLQIAIPVGKDSMSMRTVWHDDAGEHGVVAPLSLIVSAFAPVADVRRTLTPQLSPALDSELWLLDFAAGRNRLGGSALAQVYGQIGDVTPDVDDARLLRNGLEALQRLNREGKLRAYHDRSDGGLIVTLLEMAFASRCGLEIDIATLDHGNPGVLPLAPLFSEEPGVVVQVDAADRDYVAAVLAEYGVERIAAPVARPRDDDIIRVAAGDEEYLCVPRADLHLAWSETTWRMQGLRDNPRCANQEYERIREDRDPGLHAHLTFDPRHDAFARYTGARPRIAVLREQGVNGHHEMAAAFHRAGFTPVDVTMTDLLQERFSLRDFQGFAACGGFSFGDVLGAGQGWAKSILFNPRLHDEFSQFFQRADTFSLGVCNGCQMMSNIRELIPGSEHWPRFVSNRSEQFEARYVMVEVLATRSVLLGDMAGSRLPVVVSHGEGRAEFQDRAQLDGLMEAQSLGLRFVDNRGRVTEEYPYNPNGSPLGVTGVVSADGRVTIMMPHPERVFRTVQCSWASPDWGADGGWLRLFRNARRFVA